ncbi:MAG: SDR family NAD(P)-dependent oxidoreductase, partial [Calditrichia bacterium]
MGYQKADSNKDYALILGASSGFGEAVALELSSEGFNILGVHMDRGAGLTKVEQIKRQITDHKVEALYFNLNAASDKNREQVIQRCQDHFKIKNIDGKIKVVLHSLAFGSLAPYIHNDPKERLSQKQMDMTL